MAIDLEKISDSPHLLDILIQMEDVLDSLDIYVFKNWFKGQIVEGPSIRRYWLSFTLKYPYKSMPDPRAGLRLLKHGVSVEFEKAEEENADSRDRKHGLSGNHAVWLVHISMPRRLVSQVATREMDYYDQDDIDEDDIESARDSGVTDESPYENPDEQQSIEQGQNVIPPQPGQEQMNAGTPQPPPPR